LGQGFHQNDANLWHNPDPCRTSTAWAAWEAYAMAGVSPMDIQFTEFYD
jgi:hypothetical protein